MNYENLESKAQKIQEKVCERTMSEYTFRRKTSQTINRMDKAEKLAKLNTVFTPNQPVNMDFFCGRTEQLRKINKTLQEGGSHAVLYGDRGVGKTSLANFTKFLIDQKKILDTHINTCYKVNCDQTDTFGDIWRKVFKKINLTIQKNSFGFIDNSQEQIISLSSLINQKEDLKPSEVIEALNFLPPCLLIFDEFENAKNQNVRERFSYTIKALSDENPNITILLVGIAENIHGLIHDHKSLERCLKQIHLPHMDDTELEIIIDKGLAGLELNITPNAKNSLVKFSQGFPYYVHLLGKNIAEVAIVIDDENINEGHLRVAIDEAIKDAHETTRMCYDSAIKINRSTIITYEDVISACVIASEEHSDGFKTCDLRVPLQKITGKRSKEQNYRFHLEELTKQNRGSILRKIGSANKHKYIFSSPLVKAFVYLKMYQTGKVT